MTTTYSEVVSEDATENGADIFTIDAAELMLSTGLWYTARELGKALGISSKAASGFIYNIRTTTKYNTMETSLPNRKVKVISIGSRAVYSKKLWRIALGCRLQKIVDG